jgi:hypothetical protein
MLPFLNNNWLIVLVILTISDVEEDSHLMLSNILNMLQESKLILPIHTQQKTANVSSENQLLLDMQNMDPTISLKVTKLN